MVHPAYPIALGAALAAAAATFVIWTPDDPECVTELERYGLRRALGVYPWKPGCSSCGLPRYLTKQLRPSPPEDVIPVVTRVSEYVTPMLDELEHNLQWWRACPDAGPGVLEDTAHLPPMARAQHIYRECELAERGWMDIETFSNHSAHTEAGLLATAWMTDVGLSPDKASALALRHVMGSRHVNVPRGDAVVRLPRIDPGDAFKLAASYGSSIYDMDVSRRDVRFSSFGREVSVAGVSNNHLKRIKTTPEQDAINDIYDERDNAMERWRQSSRHCYRDSCNARLRIDHQTPYQLISQILYNPRTHGHFELMVVATRLVNGRRVDDSLKRIPITLVHSDRDRSRELHVTITQDDYTLKLAGVPLRREPLLMAEPAHDDQALARTYPTARLRDVLAALPGELDVVVAPEADVPYAVLVATLAATFPFDEDGRVGLGSVTWQP